MKSHGDEMVATGKPWTMKNWWNTLSPDLEKNTPPWHQHYA
jgi:hypothetical protein